MFAISFQSLLVTASIPISFSLLYVVLLIRYELFSSPLSKYPGPLLARISSVHNLYHAFKKDIHLDIWKQHEHYGDVIRYGRRRLCFRSREAYRAIYMGPSTRKSVAYDQRHPFQEEDHITFTTTDPKDAFRLRKLLASAFSPSTLAASDKELTAVADVFCQALLKNVGSNNLAESWSGPIDVGKLSSYLTLDVVMSTIYSKNLDLMRQSQYRWLVSAFLDSNRYMYLHFAWPELFASNLCTWFRVRDWLFPRMGEESRQFESLAAKLVRSLEMSLPSSRFYSALQAAKDPISKQGYSEADIRKELKSLTRSGGDTMSVTIASTLHWLSIDREWQDSVAHEIRDKFSTYEDIVPGEKLNECHRLFQVINESLRHDTPILGCPWRLLTEDSVIDGHLVPRGYEVGVCHYAMHHSTANFDQPSRFDPQRFPAAKGLQPAQGPGGFYPFSIGRRACPAKAFAERVVSLCLARAIWLTKFRPDQSKESSQLTWNGERYNETQYLLRDCFTAEKNGPVLEFQQRGRARRPWNE